MEAMRRLEAEEALGKSEARFRRITEAITDYIYTVNIQNGRPVETIHGPGCVGVTGYMAEDFREKPYLWIEMVHEEDRKRVEEQAAQILSGVKVPALEHRIIRKDGAIRWVRNTPVLNYDTRGKLLSYDALIQDITERKQSEEALRASEEAMVGKARSSRAAGVVFVVRRGRCHGQRDFEGLRDPILSWPTDLVLRMRSKGRAEGWAKALVLSSAPPPWRSRWPSSGCPVRAGRRRPGARPAGPSESRPPRPS